VRISRTKILMSPSFSSWNSKASCLEHVAPMSKFSIYSVELELHDRKVYFAHIC
jgi:hypothetical protein